MKWIQHATPATYRAAIQDERNSGRMPPAWLLWGMIEGNGWSLLQPFDQLAVFPNKGSLGGVGDPAREHEPFVILRLWRSWATRKHRTHFERTIGRFYWGLVWRRSWGLRIRWSLLNPDVFVDADGQRVHL